MSQPVTHDLCSRASTVRQRSFGALYIKYLFCCAQAFADILASNENFSAPMEETYKLLDLNPADTTTLEDYLQVRAHAHMHSRGDKSQTRCWFLLGDLRASCGIDITSTDTSTKGLDVWELSEEETARLSIRGRVYRSMEMCFSVSK